MSDVHTILINDARQALLREIAPTVGQKDVHGIAATYFSTSGHWPG